jgi:hypothetical protein
VTDFAEVQFQATSDIRQVKKKIERTEDNFAGINPLKGIKALIE